MTGHHGLEWVGNLFLLCDSHLLLLNDLQFDHELLAELLLDVLEYLLKLGWKLKLHL